MLREFLCSVNAEIHVKMQHVPQALRERDRTLMETFISLNKYTTKELYRLNLCRLFLQVECLSEICNATGDAILPEIWQGNRTHDSTSRILWPNQARPHEKSWSAWRGAIKHAYLGPEIVRARKATTHLPLNRPMGSWRVLRPWNRKGQKSHYTFTIEPTDGIVDWRSPQNSTQMVILCSRRQQHIILQTTRRIQNTSKNSWHIPKPTVPNQLHLSATRPICHCVGLW
jgi:hypothetical protein